MHFLLYGNLFIQIKITMFVKLINQLFFIINMEKKQKLRRSQSNKMIAGVCGGLAKYFGLDASLLRIIYVLVTIFTVFAGALVYIILWIIIPAENKNERLENLE